jgi:hypothetical protein
VDFDAEIGRTPGVSFGGTYDVRELESLYGDVHFNWAINFFELGGNCAWLLPNRIYEGGRYAAVPIALLHTETGRWLRKLGLGVLLESPADELERFLDGLTPPAYAELKRACLTTPIRSFVAGREDCLRLSEALLQTASVNREPPASQRKLFASNIEIR